MHICQYSGLNRVGKDGRFGATDPLLGIYIGKQVSNHDQ